MTNLLKTWWQRKSYWQKGLIVGLIFGVFIYFSIFIFMDNEFLAEPVWSISGLPLCSVFDIKSGEPCGWIVIGYGLFLFPLVYGLIGALIGLIIGKVKGK